MRKFWVLSLFGLFIFCANNAFAAGVTDAGLSRYNCVEEHPTSSVELVQWVHDENVSLLKLYEYSPYKQKEGDVDCATSEYLYYSSSFPASISPGYRMKTCITCPSGYGIATVMAINQTWDCLITYDICVDTPTCPSECPSQTEWTSISTGMEAKCLIQSGVGGCMKRCKEGYYQTWKGRWDFEHDWPGSFRCQKCPANSVHCEPGTEGHSGEIGLTMFKCEKNYYRVDKNLSTSSYVNYECQHCPSYASVPTVTSGTGATSVNRCYVPNTQHMRDAAGNEFRFSDKCYYTGTYTPGGMMQIYPQPIN